MLNLKYIHSALGEVVAFKIDRKNKRFWLFSSKTKHKFIEQNWLNLFDKRKEKAQDKITERFNDQEFEAVIDLEMAKAGYKKNGSSNK